MLVFGQCSPSDCSPTPRLKRLLAVSGSQDSCTLSVRLSVEDRDGSCTIQPATFPVVASTLTRVFDEVLNFGKLQLFPLWLLPPHHSGQPLLLGSCPNAGQGSCGCKVEM